MYQTKGVEYNSTGMAQHNAAIIQYMRALTTKRSQPQPVLEPLCNKFQIQ